MKVTTPSNQLERRLLKKKIKVKVNKVNPNDLNVSEWTSVGLYRGRF